MSRILTPVQEIKQVNRMGAAVGGLLAYLIALPIVIPIALACGAREVLARPDDDDDAPPVSIPGEFTAAFRRRLAAEENHYG